MNIPNFIGRRLQGPEYGVAHSWGNRQQEKAVDPGSHAVVNEYLAAKEIFEHSGLSRPEGVALQNDVSVTVGSKSVTFQRGSVIGGQEEVIRYRTEGGEAREIQHSYNTSLLGGGESVSVRDSEGVHGVSISVLGIHPQASLLQKALQETKAPLGTTVTVGPGGCLMLE